MLWRKPQSPEAGWVPLCACCHSFYYFATRPSSGQPHNISIIPTPSSNALLLFQAPPFRLRDIISIPMIGGVQSKEAVCPQSPSLEARLIQMWDWIMKTGIGPQPVGKVPWSQREDLHLSIPSGSFCWHWTCGVTILAIHNSHKGF